MTRSVFALFVLLVAALAVAQVQDLGLQKRIDEFAGTTTCEQQVIDTGNSLTLRAVLDDRGIDLSLDIVSAPWSVSPVEVGVSYHFEALEHPENFIITSKLLERLRSEIEDIRFRHVDETLTVEHLALLAAFYEECIGA
ncbi:MAG: hypothetical protein OXM87_06845 [Truepera sp.]|nr:hypothetical protein [Truepera sp.]